MSKVILLVNVELEPGKREEYLSTTNLLRDRFQQNGEISYSVFQNQGKEEDSFTEMFTFNDMASYEAFDDMDDEESNTLFATIIGMSKRSPKYTTLVEVD
jgi:quinol monooxygenase YgiN